MTDRSTAYHEAGHAIAARVLAVRVRSVKLVRPPPKVGFVGLTYTAAAADILMNASTRIRLATLRIDAKIIAAGPAAESRYLGLSLDDKRWWRNSWRVDRRHLRRIVDEMVRLTDGDEADAAKMYRRVAAKAQRLVAQHWATIQRVAAALEIDGELDQGEIDSLIADAAAPTWLAQKEERAAAI
jgi:hypothetical protein